MKIEVDCYSGYKANERPVSFRIGSQLFPVRQILDQWYGPDYSYFKLIANDMNIYIIRYSEKEDDWELAFFQKKN